MSTLANYEKGIAFGVKNSTDLSRALELHQAGRLAEAEGIYRRVLAQTPGHGEALHYLGLLKAQMGDFESALELAGAAVKADPQSAQAHLGLGHLRAATGQPEAALQSYDQALALKPDYPEALYSRGNALQGLKRHEEAVASYDRLLELSPDVPEVLTNRGNALHDLKRYEEALASYDRALARMPGVAMLHNNRGNTLREMKRFAEALASLDRALALEPGYVEAQINRGNVLQDLGRFEEALACFDHALASHGNLATAHHHRGNILYDLKRYEEAIISYGEALNIEPDDVATHYHQGNALAAIKRLNEALASYDRALALDPGHVEALNNRSLVLRDLKRYEDAAESFARLLEARPDWRYALGGMLQSQLDCCDWTQYERGVERVVREVRGDGKVITPFSFLAISPSASDQLLCSCSYTNDKYPPDHADFLAGSQYNHEKIRVAYLSEDFRDHALSYLTVGLFEQHTRDQFETIAVSLWPEGDGDMGRRVKAAFDKFIDVSRKGDREVVALLREMEVDIAVDLMGFTGNCRTAIFARRCAPIQVNYLGFPATMGAEYMDYIIADNFVIPEEKRSCYSEKVVYLPDCFQANDDKRVISAVMPTRADVGLPQSGFVFCSFNNSYKITPDFFSIWMRLLHKVAGSVLWLVADSDSVKNNLRAAAADRGISPQRLIFAPRISYPDHLARFRLADLFLDSLPFNAGTTASDALWAGVPVITCSGEAFASRMAGSLLNAIGLPEMVTNSPEQYEVLALRLAQDHELLSRIKSKLALNRATHPLFDTNRFRRHIEEAYVAMWERHARGEPPESFTVVPAAQHGIDAL